jgi:hypothetical protein
MTAKSSRTGLTGWLLAYLTGRYITPDGAEAIGDAPAPLAFTDLTDAITASAFHARVDAKWRRDAEVDPALPSSGHLVENLAQAQTTRPVIAPLSRFVASGTKTVVRRCSADRLRLLTSASLRPGNARIGGSKRLVATTHGQHSAGEKGGALRVRSHAVTIAWRPPDTARLT